MLKSFFASRQWALWAWGGGLLLCISIMLEVKILVWLNSWYRKVWDFLQHPHPSLKTAISDGDTDWNRTLTALDGEVQAIPDGVTTLTELANTKIDLFWEFIGEFCLIAFPFIFLRSFSNFFAQHYAFRWRQAITFAYLPFWTKAPQEIEGASQRMQEDPQKFALLVENLGLGFFRDLLTLIAFTPILWGLSVELSNNFQKAVGLNIAPFDLPFLRWTAELPGSLMWVALGLSVGATIISYFVGIKLPGLHYDNQKVEASFRKQLVYGEDDKRFADIPTITELFTGLRFNYFRLYLHTTYFNVWASLFGQFLIIVDLMLIGTGVVLGIITLGVINQVSHAFSKVSDSLKYLVDNWKTVTELMSVIKRLREFECNISYKKSASPADAPPVQIIR